MVWKPGPSLSKVGGVEGAGHSNTAVFYVCNTLSASIEQSLHVQQSLVNVYQ